jgi:Fusaric acid resistance protein-like
VVAAFVTLMGTSDTGEQVRKAFFRIVGTLAGIVVGSLLVTAVGHHPYWSIVVILASLFFGFYLNRPTPTRPGGPPFHRSAGQLTEADRDDWPPPWNLWARPGSLADVSVSVGLRCDRMRVDRPYSPVLRGQRGPQPRRAMPAQV